MTYTEFEKWIEDHWGSWDDIDSEEGYENRLKDIFDINNLKMEQGILLKHSKQGKKALQKFFGVMSISDRVKFKDLDISAGMANAKSKWEEISRLKPEAEKEISNAIWKISSKQENLMKQYSDVLGEEPFKAAEVYDRIYNLVTQDKDIGTKEGLSDSLQAAKDYEKRLVDLAEQFAEKRKIVEDIELKSSKISALSLNPMELKTLEEKNALFMLGSSPTLKQVRDIFGLKADQNAYARELKEKLKYRSGS